MRSAPGVGTVEVSGVARGPRVGSFWQPMYQMRRGALFVDMVGMVQVTDEDQSPETTWNDAAASFTRWIDGDQEGFSELMDVMTPVLWHVVRAGGLDAMQAKDVIQETWFALVRRRDAIDHAQSVASWLLTTARRESWRVAKASRRDIVVADLEVDVPAPRQPSTENVVLEQDEHRRLWEAVATLDERCQRLLRVVAFDTRPNYQKLSEDLDMPVGSIGPTRGRCLSKLRTALGGAYTEEVGR